MNRLAGLPLLLAFALPSLAAPAAEIDPWRLLESGAAEEAAARFAERLAAAPESGDAAAGRVRSLLRLDRWREAQEEARALPAQVAEIPIVAAAIGEAFFRAGAPWKAERILEPLAGGDDPPVRALLILGRLRQARGRTAEALRLRERALAAAPDDRDVLFWASELAPTRLEAIRLLERFLELADGAEEERIEAARSAIGVYRKLGEREVWRAVSEPQRVELPLKRIWDDRGRVLGYVLRVGLGPRRKPVKLLLDTGSNGLFLVERVAKRRGFEPLAGETVFGGGGDRRHATSRGLFSRVAMGELVFEDALASTTPEELEPQGRFHGVLGISVFAGWSITLDLERERLVLERATETDEGQPYWVVAGQMLVRAGVPDGPEGMFLFDTGASGTFVARSFADALQLTEWGRSGSVRTFGGRMESRTVSGVTLAFGELDTGGRSLTAVDLSLRSRLGRIEIAGYLGLDLWQGRRIRIDSVAQRVLVETVKGR